MKIKLDINKNFWHLAPGYKGQIWNYLKSGNLLGYEWCYKEYDNLKNFSKKRKYSSIIKRITDVKKGDYICIISGRDLLGIAEVTKPYKYPESKNNVTKALKKLFETTEVIEFQTVEVEWLEKFTKPYPRLNTIVVKTFVRLNNGKRWESLKRILKSKGYLLDKMNTDEIEDGLDKKLKRFIKEHEKYEWKRDPKFVKEFKNNNKHKGCFACKTNPDSKYKLEQTFTLLEFHHIEPLSTLKNNKNKLSTKKSSLLCPNCHRAIHRAMCENDNEIITPKSFYLNFIK